MYPGRKITLGGRVLLVPGLSLRQSKQFEGVQNELLNPTTDTNPWSLQEKAIPMYAEAIRRNHPDVTDDFVADNVDLNTCKQLLKFVVGNNELTELETSLGEESAPEVK